MRVATRLLKSACSLLFMAVLCAAFSGSWLHPSLAWSEVVLVKKSPASSTVYLASVTSSEFPSAQQMECAPENFSCAKQNNNPGPLPDALKSSYVNELRANGVIVVMEKPSQDIFYEVSVSFIIRDLPASPPTVPASYVCDVMGSIIRRGTEGKQKSGSLDRHNVADSNSASSAMRTCLKPAASIVRKGIEAITPPRSKKTKQ